MPELLWGWGRTAPTAATVVPASAIDVALGDPGERGVIARGRGRAYGDAAQNAGGTVIDMTAGSSAEPVLDAATGIVTASGGTTFDQLLRFLVPRGWFVPVTPGTRHVTTGGAVAADVHGKNHTADGSWMDHVTSIEVVLASGEVRAIGPADDGPAFWATAGGMGLTGVVTSCSFRAVPIASSTMLVDTSRVPDLDAAFAAMAAAPARYAVAWLDASAGGQALGRGVVTTADHAPRSDGDDDPLSYRPRSLGSAPPVALIGRRSIAVLNELRYRAAPARRVGERQTVTAFFHPLDAVAGWNRLYGRRGLIQWQCAVPDGAEPVVATVLASLQRAGAASHVTVLKRFRRGNAGPLSFPIAGWTLAFDLPAAPSLGPTLDALDRVVADAGGRIYLAKDARLDPGLVATMYPRLDEWRAARDRLDPAGALQSDLGRRLALIGRR